MSLPAEIKHELQILLVSRILQARLAELHLSSVVIHTLTLCLLSVSLSLHLTVVPSICVPFLSFSTSFAGEWFIYRAN